MLDSQDYIKEVKIWDGEEVDYDFTIRYNVIRGIRNLVENHMRCFNLPKYDETKKWLSVKPKKVAKVIFSRSSRNHNKDFNWKTIWKFYSISFFLIFSS